MPCLSGAAACFGLALSSSASISSVMDPLPSSTCSAICPVVSSSTSRSSHWDGSCEMLCSRASISISSEAHSRASGGALPLATRTSTSAPVCLSPDSSSSSSHVSTVSLSRRTLERSRVPTPRRTSSYTSSCQQSTRSSSRTPGPKVARSVHMWSKTGSVVPRTTSVCALIPAASTTTKGSVFEATSRMGRFCASTMVMMSGVMPNRWWSRAAGVSLAAMTQAKGQMAVRAAAPKRRAQTARSEAPCCRGRQRNRREQNVGSLDRNFESGARKTKNPRETDQCATQSTPLIAAPTNTHEPHTALGAHTTLAHTLTRVRVTQSRSRPHRCCPCARRS